MRFLGQLCGSIIGTVLGYSILLGACYLVWPEQTTDVLTAISLALTGGET